jgi:hypothetical protein
MKLSLKNEKKEMKKLIFSLLPYGYKLKEKAAREFCKNYNTLRGVCQR